MLLNNFRARRQLSHASQPIPVCLTGPRRGRHAVGAAKLVMTNDRFSVVEIKSRRGTVRVVKTINIVAILDEGCISACPI